MENKFGRGLTFLRRQYWLWLMLLGLLLSNAKLGQAVVGYQSRFFCDFLLLHHQKSNQRIKLKLVPLNPDEKREELNRRQHLGLLRDSVRWIHEDVDELSKVDVFRQFETNIGAAELLAHFETQLEENPRAYTLVYIWLGTMGRVDPPSVAHLINILELEAELCNLRFMFFTELANQIPLSRELKFSDPGDAKQAALAVFDKRFDLEKTKLDSGELKEYFEIRHGIRRLIKKEKLTKHFKSLATDQLLFIDFLENRLSFFDRGQFDLFRQAFTRWGREFKYFE